MTSRWSAARSAPAAAGAAGLAVLVVYLLRELLAPGFDRLPGTDAGNLYAWEIFTRSALAQWTLPHWNPYEFGGTPHLADTQTTVLYPPALLLRALPPLAFLPWMVALHLWLGGVGMLVLARVTGLGWFASTAGAVAVTLGGSAAPWLANGHLLIIYCVAWLPWALAMAIVSVRRPSVWPHPLLVAVLVLQFLSGYLQGSVYITAAVSLYFLYSVAWPEPAAAGRSRWRPAAQLAVLSALALGTAAFQLVPTARLVLEAGRTSGLTFEQAVEGAWAPRDLLTLLVPSRGMTTGEGHGSLADRIAYVGWLLTLLAPIALFGSRRRLAVFFGLLSLAAMAFALAIDLPLYRLHHALLPGFRIPGRLLFLATVGIALVGAIGLDRVLAAVRTRSTKAAALAGVAAVFLVSADLVAFWSGAVETVPLPSPDAVQRSIGSPDGGRVLSLCERIVGPNDLLAARHPTFDGVGGVFLRRYADWASLAASEGPLPVRRDLLDVSNVTTVLACDPLDEPSLVPLSAGDGIRAYRNESAWPRAVWTCAAESLPRAEVLRQLRTGRYDAARRFVRGYLVNVRWAPGLTDADRQVRERRYRLREPEYREGTTWRYRVHDLTRDDIRALLADPAAEDTHGFDRQSAEFAAPEESAGAADEPQLLIGTGQCDEPHEVRVVAADGPDGRTAVEMAAASDGVVFFSEPYYAERRAFVDGVEATPLAANVAFTAVRVPAGSHLVELRYVPSGLRMGAAVSGASLAAWTGALVAARRRRRAAQTAAHLPPAAHG